MLANLTKFGQSAAQKAAKFAESVGPAQWEGRIRAEYEIQSATPVGYAGPSNLWSIYRGRRKRTTDGMLDYFAGAVNDHSTHQPVRVDCRLAFQHG